MKRIIKYKLFEGNVNSRDLVINDIMLDLTDDGFKFNTKWFYDQDPPELRIAISKSSSFIYEDIRDTIDRLSGYLESIGYSTNSKSSIVSKSITIWYKFSSLSLLKAKSKYRI